jgi:hypothetical protein
MNIFFLEKEKLREFIVSRPNPRKIAKCNFLNRNEIVEDVASKLQGERKNLVIKSMSKRDKISF